MNKQRRVLSEITPLPENGKSNFLYGDSVASERIDFTKEKYEKENGVRYSLPLSSVPVTTATSRISDSWSHTNTVVPQPGGSVVRNSMRAMRVPAENQYMLMEGDDDDDNDDDESDKVTGRANSEVSTSALMYEDLGDKFNNTTSVASLGDDSMHKNELLDDTKRRRFQTDDNALFYNSYTPATSIDRLPDLTAGTSVVGISKCKSAAELKAATGCETRCTTAEAPLCSKSNDIKSVQAFRNFGDDFGNARLTSGCKQKCGGMLNHYHSAGNLSRDYSVMSSLDHSFSLSDLNKSNSTFDPGSSARATLLSNADNSGVYRSKGGAMRVPVSFQKFMEETDSSAVPSKPDEGHQVEDLNKEACDEISQASRSVRQSTTSGLLGKISVEAASKASASDPQLRHKLYPQAADTRSNSCVKNPIKPSSLIFPTVEARPSLASVRQYSGVMQSHAQIQSSTPKNLNEHLLRTPVVKDIVLSGEGMKNTSDLYRDRQYKTSELISSTGSNDIDYPPHLSELSYELLKVLNSKKKASKPFFGPQSNLDDNSSSYNVNQATNINLSDCFANLNLEPGIVPLSRSASDNQLMDSSDSKTSKPETTCLPLNHLGSNAMDSILLHRHPEKEIPNKFNQFAVPLPIQSAKKRLDSVGTSERSGSYQLYRDEPVHPVYSAHRGALFAAAPAIAGNQNVVSAEPVMRELPIKGSQIIYINNQLYILIKQIGSGGSSKVYHAISEDGRNCAVKCVDLDNAEESTINGFRNEITLLQKLQNNEEIVKLYDYMFEEANSRLYVVMEKGDMDLATYFRVKRKNMNVRRLLIRPFWIEMLQAVYILHQNGIVHSDLKPANFILVCGQVKLIDFGIAKTIAKDHTSVTCDQVVGTVNYMSPEAVIDQNGGRDFDGEYKPYIKISTKSDVWSLGCILYMLVYSRAPFESVKNSIMKLQAIINPNHTIDFPPYSDHHAVDILKKCLVRNPRARPSIEELLDHPYVTG